MNGGEVQLEKLLERFAPKLRTAARMVADYVDVSGLSERKAFDVIAGVLAFDQDAQRLAVLPASRLSPQDDVRATLLDEWMAPWAAAVRTELFGAPEPPCADHEAAATLIRSEHERPQLDPAQVRELQSEIIELSLDFQRGLAELEERGLWTRFPAARTIAYPDLDLSFIDGDGSVVNLGVDGNQLLSRLALAADEMAEVSGWSMPQATAYILTGQRQYTPHVSVLSHAAMYSPRHGQPAPLARSGATIVIRASDFSYEELRALWTQLRRQGVTEKKPLSEKHARVWRFARERRATMTMTAIVEEWNAKNPDETYTERGFWKAYSRAEKKGGVVVTPRKAGTDTV